VTNGTMVAIGFGVLAAGAAVFAISKYSAANAALQQRAADTAAAARAAGAAKGSNDSIGLAIVQLGGAALEFAKNYAGGPKEVAAAKDADAAVWV